MKTLAKIVSYAALGLTVLPAVGVFTGAIPHGTHRDLMFAGMVLWFVSAPVWMKKN